MIDTRGGNGLPAGRVANEMLRLSAYAGLGMTAADIAARYRIYAAHCVELAKASSEFTNKLVLLEMARAWLDLADQAEKNGETVIVYETPAQSK